MDLIDRSNLPRIRITGYFKDRLLEEVIGVLNDAIQKAPTVDAVPREEHESLLKRFRHLLESDFIRSFDEYDPKTGTYKRDISEADIVAYVIRCRRCEHFSVRACKNYLGDLVVEHWCDLWGNITALDDFCSEGVLHEPEVRVDENA